MARTSFVSRDLVHQPLVVRPPGVDSADVHVGSCEKDFETSSEGTMNANLEYESGKIQSSQKRVGVHVGCNSQSLGSPW